MMAAELETTDGNLQRAPWALDGLSGRCRERLEALVDPDLRASGEWLPAALAHLAVPYNVAALLEWSRAQLLLVPGFGRATLGNLESVLRDYGVQLEMLPRVVRERPLLLSGPLVRQVLAGRKTVTRRILRPMLCAGEGGPGRARLISMDPVHGRATFGDSIPDDPSQVGVNCPYGAEGERLWVREAFHAVEAEGEVIDTVYRATDELQGCGISKWTPSIHMPRWASRIDLEVVSVRPERLHEITTAEIRAEGVDDGYTNPKMGKRHDAGMRMAFQKLWDKINGDRVVKVKRDGEVKEYPGLMAWDANPWVWRVEFCLLRPAPLADVIPIGRGRGDA